METIRLGSPCTSLTCRDTIANAMAPLSIMIWSPSEMMDVALAVEWCLGEALSKDGRGPL
jgi:hypothetical protein